MKFNPHDYQDFCIRHQLKNPFSALFLDMGLGKTVITGTTIDKLKFDSFEVDKVLIIAPKKVAETTWKDEFKKWDHLKHLKYSIVLGTARQRIEALRKKADVYIINVENVPWLVGFYQSKWPFDCVVIDELSKFKNPSSVRFRALKGVRPKIKRILALTGTPVPNGLLDLWSQMYLLDRGERLGDTITSYRMEYFTPAQHDGHTVHSWQLRERKNEERIMNRISDICVSMKSVDYLDLPQRIDVVKKVELPKKIMERYHDFERELVLEFEDLDDITASNAAVLTGKLLQFANGAIYDENKDWHELHTAKLEMLEEEIEEANGNPMLVGYYFKHDLLRMMKYLKKYKPVKYEGERQLRAWNKGQIQVLFGHPASMGHGLNMQDGGHLITWFGNQWGLENYLQFIARLDRQGQTKPVYNGRIVAAGTIDEEVVRRIDSKDKKQNSAMNYVKAVFERYRA